MSLRPRSLGRVAPANLAVAFLAGCVGSGEGVPNPDPTGGAAPKSFAEIQAMVFDPMCAAQCHKGGGAPKALSLELGRSARGLVGVSSAEVSGMLRVAPGDPDNSYLVAKVAVSDPRRVGLRMPRNGPPFVSPAQLRAIRAWIRAGAKETWEAGDDEPDAAFRPNAGSRDAEPEEGEDE